MQSAFRRDLRIRLCELETGFLSAEAGGERFLKHYATRLNAVEINYTFRQLPKAATLEKWVAATPDGFLFACKAHMRITHINRLQESEFTGLFFKALEPLRASRRLGPVLFQLPPNFKAGCGLVGRVSGEAAGGHSHDV